MEHVLIKGRNSKDISESLYNFATGLGLQSFKKIVLDLSKCSTLFKLLDSKQSSSSIASLSTPYANNKKLRQSALDWLVCEMSNCTHTCYIIINNAELLTQSDLNYLIHCASKCKFYTMFILSQLLDEDESKAKEITDMLINTLEITGIFTVEQRYGLLMSSPS